MTQVNVPKTSLKLKGWYSINLPSAGWKAEST